MKVLPVALRIAAPGSWWPWPVERPTGALAHRWTMRGAVLLALLLYAVVVAQRDPTHQSLWIAAAIFFAATVSSVAGFAFSAIAGAMLFHLVDDPVHCVQIMMVCSIAGQSLMVWSVRRHIEWRRVAPFLAGAAIGLPLGVLALFEMKSRCGVAIGILVILYAAVMLLRPSGRVRVRNRLLDRLLDGLVGVLGGITGGAAAFPGAFVTIWCGLQGGDKERQRALYQPFILITQVAGVVLLQAIAAQTGRHLTVGLDSLTYVPATLLGTALGLAFFRRLNDRQFAIAVNLLLIVSGVSLVV
jgi:uncharacterized membrane protein YfcA